MTNVSIISFFTSLSLFGSIVNCLGVIFGSLCGLAVKRFIGASAESGAISRVSDTLMKGVALCVMLIGIMGAIKTENIIIVILSIVIGGVIGEMCDLQSRIEKLGDLLERKTKGRFGSITQGFVSASLLFCVGAMAIVGSLNSGLLHDHSMLYTKSLIDMISAFVFATTLGFGVMLSAFLVLIYQGTITLLASFLAPLLTEMAINEMTAVGSLLILGLSLNMLQITKIKVMNYVPAVFIALFICLIL